MHFQLKFHVKLRCGVGELLQNGETRKPKKWLVPCAAVKRTNRALQDNCVSVKTVFEAVKMPVKIVFVKPQNWSRLKPY